MEKGRSFSQWKFLLITGSIAVFVTAVFTYPLLFNLDTHIVGFWASDAINHAWTAWWYQKAIIVLNQSPAELTHIYYPTAVHHPLITATAWAKITAFPWMSISNPIKIYNIHFFIARVLTWMFTSLLCLKLTNNKIAALLGGAIFTFSINLTAHAFNGHFTQTLTYSYPLLVLAFLRLKKHPNIKNGFLLGLAMSMLALLDLMPLAYFGIPMMIGLLLFLFTSKKRKPFSKEILLSLSTALLVSILIVIPVTWSLLFNGLQGNLDWYQSSGSGDFSADFLALFVPPPEHPASQIWPALHQLSDTVYSFGQSKTEALVYAGWITLGLAGIGLVKKWDLHHDIRLWFLLAVICTILSLGPLLRLNGKLVTVAEVPVIMPYALFLKTPFLSWGRTPARFNGTVMFALGILASYGATYLLNRLNITWQKSALGAVLFALILVDSILIFPWPMMSVATPAVFEEIAADARSVAVLDLPVLSYDAAKFHLLYQLTHQHALVGGYRTRRPHEATVAMERLQAAALPGGDIIELTENSVAYVVIHHRFYTETKLEEIREYLVNQVGQAIYSDIDITVFTVPNSKEAAPIPLNAK